MTYSQGEVFDLGYQHYSGPREGRMRARKALWANGVRTILGLGRGSRAKILPILLFISAMIPALVFTLIASQSDTVENIVGHAGYYQIVLVVIYIFAAIMAPELLCPDRREGVISLYLVRPLTSTDYIMGRWLAFFSVTLAIVYFGQTVLFVGLTLAAEEPLSYLRDNWLDVPRFLGAGMVIALFITTIPMTVAAFTKRRAYAAAIVIGIFLICHGVAGALTATEYNRSPNVTPGPNSEYMVPPKAELGTALDGEPVTGEAGKWLTLIDMGAVTIYVNDLIFDRENDEQTAILMRELPVAVPILWYIFTVVGPGYVLWRRYQMIET
ncbi:ABC transporter permease [Chloroflexota bacterium]